MVYLKFICIHLVDLYDEFVNRPYIESLVLGCKHQQQHPKQQPQQQQQRRQQQQQQQPPPQPQPQPQPQPPLRMTIFYDVLVVLFLHEK